jgi:hypothetical protein
MFRKLFRRLAVRFAFRNHAEARAFIAASRRPREEFGSNRFPASLGEVELTNPLHEDSRFKGDSPQPSGEPDADWWGSWWGK